MSSAKSFLVSLTALAAFPIPLPIRRSQLSRAMAVIKQPSHFLTGLVCVS